MKRNSRLRAIIFTFIFTISICFSLQSSSVVYSENKTLKMENVITTTMMAEETFYRVIVGSFKDSTNANNMVVTMNNLGIDAFISSEIINGQTYNRVIVGSFKNKVNADSMVSTIKNMGYDAFVDTYTKCYTDEPIGSNSTSKSTYYAVIAGSFNDINNARARIKELEADGFECYISTEVIDGKTYNRIITGSFINKDNAQKRVNELVATGYEAFIDIYVVNNEVVSQNQSQGKTTYYAVIVGSFKEYSNAQNMVSELKGKGIDCYISPTNVNGKMLNRVIAGSFVNKDNASNMVNTLGSYGYEAFIDVYVQ